MPSIEHRGATIYYEEFGQGFPVLTFAPAGLRSVIDVWRQPSAPINPIADFTDEFRMIAMDQRNAGGRSRAPITAQDHWDDYTADHIAVLDALGIEKCHLYGQCIGGSFIINMLKHHPERVQSAVLAQPIGRVGPLKLEWNANFKGWTETLTGRADASHATLDAFYRNLYAPGFVYRAGRDFVTTIKTPCLLLAGNDEAHPWPISEELSKLIPHCQFIPEWKEEPALAAAKALVMAFLKGNTPAR